MFRNTCSNTFGISLAKNVVSVILQDGTFFFWTEPIRTLQTKSTHRTLLFPSQCFLLCHFFGLDLKQNRHNWQSAKPSSHHVVQSVSVCIYMSQKGPTDTQSSEVRYKEVLLKCNNETFFFLSTLTVCKESLMVLWLRNQQSTFPLSSMTSLFPVWISVNMFFWILLFAFCFFVLVGLVLVLFPL